MKRSTLRPIDSTDRAVAGALAMASSGVTDPEQWLIDAIGGGPSKAGPSVTTASVMGLPTVWSAVSRIAGDLGRLPLEVRRRTTGESSEVAKNHPGYRLLNRAPNDIQTPMTFRETLAMHAILRGDGRAWIERNTQNRPVELVLMPLENSATCMVDGVKWHTVYIPPDYLKPGTRRVMGIPVDNAGNLQRTGTLYKIPDRDVFHVPGLSYNGIHGLDLVSLAKDTFGLDMAGRDTASYSFRNNGRPSLLLEAPANQLRTAKDAKEFLDAFNEAHEGLDNSGKTGLIRDGMKAHVLPLSAADAQHLENRRFSQEDIALLFGTEHLLGSSAVYKNLTERQAAYVQGTLGRWFERYEQEGYRKLLSERERTADSHFFRYNPIEILRGDLNAMASYTSSMRQQGAMSGNDVRRFHQLPPVPGLDDYTNPNIATDDTYDDVDPAPTPEPDDAAALLLRARRRNVVANLHKEARWLASAAKKHNGNASAFESAAVGFYERFGESLASMLLDLGLPEQRAADYVNGSQDRLAMAVGTCTGDLQSVIETITADWPADRAGELIE